MVEDVPALAVPTSVRERRKAKKLTQEQLAELAGMSTAAIHNLEAGKNGFTDKSLAALAAALECSPAELLKPMMTAGKIGKDEASIRAMLRQIDGMPEAGIGPTWRMIRGLLEDAGQLGPDLPRDQFAPANRRRVSEPSPR